MKPWGRERGGREDERWEWRLARWWRLKRVRTQAKRTKWWNREIGEWDGGNGNAMEPFASPQGKEIHPYVLFLSSRGAVMMGLREYWRVKSNRNEMTTDAGAEVERSRITSRYHGQTREDLVFQKKKKIIMIYFDIESLTSLVHSSRSWAHFQMSF